MVVSKILPQKKKKCSFSRLAETDAGVQLPSVPTEPFPFRRGLSGTAKAQRAAGECELAPFNTF